MDYLIAILAGSTLGVIAGVMKYLILWRPLLKNKRKFTNKTIFIAQILSVFISVLVLLSVYFLRGQWPYSFEITILTAAVALSLMGRLSPLRDMKKLEAAEKQAMDEKTNIKLDNNDS